MQKKPELRIDTLKKNFKKFLNHGKVRNLALAWDYNQQGMEYMEKYAASLEQGSPEKNLQKKAFSLFKKSLEESSRFNSDPFLNITLLLRDTPTPKNVCTGILSLGWALSITEKTPGQGDNFQKIFLKLGGLKENQDIVDELLESLLDELPLQALEEVLLFCKKRLEKLADKENELYHELYNVFAYADYLLSERISDIKKIEDEEKKNALPSVTENLIMFSEIFKQEREASLLIVTQTSPKNDNMLKL
jgi:hypothetical protein